MLDLIVAHNHRRVIGDQGDLPWHCPDDLRHFRKITLGRHCIMGRRTYDSLPGELDGRTSVVMTRSGRHLGDETVTGIDELMRAVVDWESPIVIGGESVYRQLLPWVQRIYLSIIDDASMGDARFPAIDPRQWRTVSRRSGEGVEFLKLERS